LRRDHDADRAGGDKFINVLTTLARRKGGEFKRVATDQLDRGSSARCRNRPLALAQYELRGT
jgi:hypothetical protein